MALTIGTQLGSLEITALLGKGGMGEVYRARDTKLKREVAIKVLPDEFSHDPERIARFQREAEALALLNHPNIGSIYDLQEAGGFRFLVLELVEGDTLADRLKRGPIPADEALKIAVQITEAIEAAHEKSIVHRDLKPANVKITPDGKVKVLDFGLAKAMENAPAASTLSNSPTLLSMAGTQAGLILGTAGYMSPEQAKGFTADARSDVFAFGCVLFEMLTGRQLFQGETVHEILGSVLVLQPDLSSLPPNLNPRIGDLLRRCLEKNPKNRWQAAGDLRLELESIAGQPYATAESRAARPPLWKRAIPIVITAIVSAVVARFVPAWTTQPPVPAAVTRFSVDYPESHVYRPSFTQSLVISPDGKTFVYNLVGRTYIRSMSSLEWRALLPNSASGAPFFSPDGQWIGFFSDGALKKVATTGGGAVTICKALSGPGTAASWSDDQIVFNQPGGIMRVSANGGEPELLVRRRNNEFLANPQLLNQTVLLFAVAKEEPDRWDKAEIVAQSLKSGERKVLVRGGSAEEALFVMFPRDTSSMPWVETSTPSVSMRRNSRSKADQCRWSKEYREHWAAWKHSSRFPTRVLLFTFQVPPVAAQTRSLRGPWLWRIAMEKFNLSDFHHNHTLTRGYLRTGSNSSLRLKTKKT
jgi:serine/threonine-protein kinase